MKKRTIVFIIVTVLLLATFTPASAQELEETPACVGDQVSGTVVAVDEEAGLVTIDYGDGECTVTLTADYGHPKRRNDVPGFEHDKTSSSFFRYSN